MRVTAKNLQCRGFVDIPEMNKWFEDHPDYFIVDIKPIQTLHKANGFDGEREIVHFVYYKEKTPLA